MSMDFLRIKRLAAFGAHHHRIEGFSAHFRCSCSSGLPRSWTMWVSPPMNQRHHDRIQIEPLLGQDVFVPLLVIPDKGCDGVRPVGPVSSAVRQADAG